MSTNQLSLERQHQSRNMQEDILHAIAEKKQVNVARHIGVEPSTVGRWIDAKNQESQVVRFCDMLAFCGLKIVPANAKCYNKDKIDILFHLTKEYFQNLEVADDFFQGDAGMSESSDVRFSRVSGLSGVSTRPNIVFALLARCIEAYKSLIAPKNVIRPTLLVARLNLDAEMQQERQDIVADQAVFRKLVYVLFQLAGWAFVLFTLIHFWGK